MLIIDQSHEILAMHISPELIELAGRTCYKSESKGNPEGFVSMLLGREHLSVLEHSLLTVRFITNRGVTHEIVRHRPASFSQESTRYVSSIDKSSYLVTSVEEAVDAYRSGLSMKRVAELSRGFFTEWDVYKALEQADVPRRSKGNNGPVNHEYFDVIDTPEKAYLLGLIVTDGSVRKDAPQLTITQHKDYFWFLHRLFRNEIAPGAKFGRDRNCRNVSVVSERLCASLAAKGVIPNKTYEFGREQADLLWKAVPDELKYDLVRGLLDGDGCVRFFHQKNKGQTFSCNITFVGPRALLDKLQLWMKEDLSYSPNILKHGDSGVIQKLSITNPEIGLEYARRSCKNLVMPYGHPKKTARLLEHIEDEPTRRFANWGDKKFIVVRPSYFSAQDAGSWVWMEAMDNAEEAYRDLLRLGERPEQARGVLPNDLKTEIVVSANAREWRHIFKLRASPKAHPDMRALMIPLLRELQGSSAAVLFNDIEVKE